jgi:hypothetical protein
MVAVDPYQLLGVQPTSTTVEIGLAISEALTVILRER